MLIANSRIVRALLLDKMVREVKKGLVVTFQVSSLASLGTQWLELVAVSADSRQRWCAPKAAANSFQDTFLGNTSSP